jgi:26S proteasome regulatory subunit N9
MEMFFILPSENRTLSFTEISQKLRVAKEAVEMLVMKAMSLKLIKGSIDEVNEKVNINWVQPRILSHDQIQQMRNRLDKWTQNVKETLYFMEEQANPNEVFA